MLFEAGFNQIVGHTPRRQGGVAKYAKTENYCIDTSLRELLIGICFLRRGLRGKEFCTGIGIPEIQHEGHSNEMTKCFHMVFVTMLFRKVSRFCLTEFLTDTSGSGLFHESGHSLFRRFSVRKSGAASSHGR